MKSKKIVCFVCLLCTVVLIASCQKKSTDTILQGEKETTKDKVVSQEKNIDKDHKESGNVDSMKQEKLDLDKYSLDYQEETDFQPFFLNNSAAKSANGYYVWGVGKYSDMLLFTDMASGKTIPLCNRPNCKHEQEKESCNAYFSSATEGKITYEPSYVQYYENNLYILGWNSDGYVCLFKVSADGSNREEYMRLYRADTSNPDKTNESSSSEWLVPDVCIHRGYVYFINQRESNPKIRRMKLGNNEDVEVIYETNGSRPNLYRMEGYGDFVFFQTGHYTDSSLENTEGGIYAYNIQNGEISFVKRDAISTYMVKNDAIYYATEKEVRKYSLSNQADEIFCKTKETYPVISLDSNYVYVVNDMIISVYDYEGKVVGEVSQEKSIEYYFGDDRFCFALCTGNDENSENIKVLKKQNIKNGKDNWEDLYSPS